MASTHRVRGHYRDGHWVRPHYRKNPARGAARSRAGDGAIAVLLAVGLTVWAAVKALDWLAAHWWIAALAVAVAGGCWVAVRRRPRAVRRSDGSGNRIP